MVGPIIRNYDKKLWKKCIKCRQWKPYITHDDAQGTERKRAFGKHEGNADGVQVICYSCKTIMGSKARSKNPVQRVRHHTGTRCLTQLGDLAPEGFLTDLEDYLGYRIQRLVKHLSADLKEREGPDRKLRDALEEGYHIDHIHPLSKFKVVVRSQQQVEFVDWDAFKKCWAMENLRAIPATENLQKGAKTDEDNSTHVEAQEEETTTPEVTIDIALQLDSQTRDKQR